MTLEIKLPSFLHAEIDFEDTDPRSNWWGNTYRYFIVLKFGQVQVARWEWQADRPIDERSELEQSDVDEFVAAKLRPVFFPPL